MRNQGQSGALQYEVWAPFQATRMQTSLAPVVDLVHLQLISEGILPTMPAKRQTLDALVFVLRPQQYRYDQGGYWPEERTRLDKVLSALHLDRPISLLVLYLDTVNREGYLDSKVTKTMLKSKTRKPNFSTNSLA